MRLGGRYEIGAAIGSGGFATVFRARDLDRDEEVAIKLVPPLFGVRTRLLQHEADVLRRISSRFVARIYDSGEDESGSWLVMELVDGAPLQPSTFDRPLLPHEVLRVSRGLLEGLIAAHAAGIVHGDVKASNVLVPRTQDALDAPKLIDFGLARSVQRAIIARELGAPVREGEPGSATMVVGSLPSMAPEVLRGAEPTFASDLYGAGMVLFDLLGVGPLFDGATTEERLRQRMVGTPAIDGRVPEPLASVLARLLAREPEQRFADAQAAYEMVTQLDTAPVSVVDESVSSRRPDAPASVDGSGVRSVPPSRASLVPSVRVLAVSEPASPRLGVLPAGAAEALFETLRHLDLGMLDALGRRERGNPFGRVARACALALRLELDTAALVLEPLNVSVDAARAASAGLLSPCARRVTRARVDTDRDDAWVDAAPAEIAAVFAGFGASLAGRDDGVRDAKRCARAERRVDGPRFESLDTTIGFARSAAQTRSASPAEASLVLDRLVRLDLPSGRRYPFDAYVRSMAIASVAATIDAAYARDELERAHHVAVVAGATLLEVAAVTALGRLMVDVPSRVDQARALLERASTLLAHGDAPTLEHEAQHYRAAALVASGRHGEAVPFLRAAREAAHAERSLELEVLSTSLEVVSLLATGARLEAAEAAASLGDARIGTASARAAGFAWLARSLDRLAEGDLDAARDALAVAKSRVHDTPVASSADALLVVEVLALAFEVADDASVNLLARVAELETMAEDRGFGAFYWFDVLEKVLGAVTLTLPHGPDLDTVRSMATAISRLTVLLGPSSRLARERRTSAPPPNLVGAVARQRGGP